eukprot:GHVO01069395.1.p1 GENE.GHVO01069395.1~~GHVO01069395.1.p1  ORF type:complete len:155 (+),score=2.93 GHVO01069395.1:69-533(+)
MVGLSAIMLWKALILVTGSPSPIVVVLSGSMEPGYARGDILLLYNRNRVRNTGDVLVYQTHERDIPIVHRNLELHEARRTNETVFLTKGDANNVHDRGLYPRGQMWLRESQVLGTSYGYVPLLGYFTILANDYPIVKKGMIFLIGYFVLISKER